MAESTLVGLGKLRFQVDALNFQKIERKFDYRWVPQERLGRRPAQQFLGPGEETLTLTGVIYPNHPAFGGALDELNAMRSSAGSGNFFNMGARSGGRAVARGRWCVKSIKDDQTLFAANGVPSKVEFTIELVEYGNDGASFGGFF